MKTVTSISSLEAGRFEILWDGRTEEGNEVGSGIYLYRLDAGNLVRTQKMLKLE
jgi:hypothetical protein